MIHYSLILFFDFSYLQKPIQAVVSGYTMGDTNQQACNVESPNPTTQPSESQCDTTKSNPGERLETYKEHLSRSTEQSEETSQQNKDTETDTSSQPKTKAQKTGPKDDGTSSLPSSTGQASKTHLFVDVQDHQWPIVYSTEYNIGFLGMEKMHPFDSGKWGKVFQFLRGKCHVV